MPTHSSSTPLSSPQLRLTNLPVPLTRLIGRERECREVKRLLSTTRLLTLTGSGGCGKTRLALEVTRGLGAEFSDGVWLIDLVPIADPALVPQAVASVFDLHESANLPLAQVLEDYFRNKRMLWVLDNCEHVIQACAELCHDLLQTCPDLAILATSREPLNIAGETAFRVPSLAMPDLYPMPPLQTLKECESIQLFVERATAVRTDFELDSSNALPIGQICQRLDCIPLAIELAAARVNALPIQEIAARLDDRFRLLTSGTRTSLPRHQTLRASIDWSYNLLSADEQMLLQRLSVFAGGFALEAVESICGEGLQDGTLEILLRLVQKSLVVGTLDDQPRYRLLETIRQYANEKLVGSGQADVIRDRHLGYFLALSESVVAQMAGHDRTLLLPHLDRELANLRASVAWPSNDPAVQEKQVRLIFAMRWFWRERGSLKEGYAWAQRALTLPVASERTHLRARALMAAAMMDSFRQNYRVARERWIESADIFRKLGPSGKKGLVETLAMLGAMTSWEDLVSSRPFFQECLVLAQEVGDRWNVALSMQQLGYSKVADRDFSGALVDLESSLAIAQPLGDRRLINMILRKMALVAIRQGNDDTARATCYQVLESCRGGNDRWSVFLVFGYLIVVECRTALPPWSRVARLDGAYHTVAESMGAEARLTGRDMAIQYENGLSESREQLGQVAFQQAWDEGHAMTLEQAIAYALEESPEPESVQVSPEQSDREMFGGLTPREREVAVLIAQGKSNPEIAQALVVSERTVTTHVTHILSKLGFTSRTQVASWVTAQRLT